MKQTCPSPATVQMPFIYNFNSNKTVYYNVTVDEVGRAQAYPNDGWAMFMKVVQDCNRITTSISVYQL